MVIGITSFTSLNVNGVNVNGGGGSGGLIAGNIYYVSSTRGSSAYNGKSIAYPKATLEQAYALCTANRGDVIYILPNHAETINDGLALTTAGVNIIGLGYGNAKPSFTLAGAISSMISITGHSSLISNIKVINGIDNLTVGITFAGIGLRIIDLETSDNDSNYHCDNFINIVGATDLQLLGWVHRGIAGKVGAESALLITTGSNIVVVPYSVIGNFSTAVINNDAPTTNLQIFGDGTFPAYLKTLNSADVIVNGAATTTGRVGPNINARLKDNAANITEAFVGAKMEFYQPINIVNADGESSMQTNITASTDA